MATTRTNIPAKRESKVNRPHHRTTLLTTDKKTFAKVNLLKQGEKMTIECPNDIVSSCSGGKDNNHHSIRRIRLLRRQIEGNYRKVKVRWEQGAGIPCVLTGKISGDIDGSSFRVEVAKPTVSA